MRRDGCRRGGWPLSATLATSPRPRRPAHGGARHGGRAAGRSGADATRSRTRIDRSPRAVGGPPGGRPGSPGPPSRASGPTTRAPTRPPPRPGHTHRHRPGRAAGSGQTEPRGSPTQRAPRYGGLARRRGLVVLGAVGYGIAQTGSSASSGPRHLILGRSGRQPKPAWASRANRPATARPAAPDSAAAGSGTAITGTRTGTRYRPGTLGQQAAAGLAEHPPAARSSPGPVAPLARQGNDAALRGACSATGRPYGWSIRRSYGGAGHSSSRCKTSVEGVRDQPGLHAAHPVCGPRRRSRRWGTT